MANLQDNDRRCLRFFYKRYIQRLRLKSSHSGPAPYSRNNLIPGDGDQLKILFDDGLDTKCLEAFAPDIDIAKTGILPYLLNDDALSASFCMLQRSEYRHLGEAFAMYPEEWIDIVNMINSQKDWDYFAQRICPVKMNLSYRSLGEELSKTTPSNLSNSIVVKMADNFVGKRLLEAVEAIEQEFGLNNYMIHGFHPFCRGLELYVELKLPPLTQAYVTMAIESLPPKPLLSSIMKKKTKSRIIGEETKYLFSAAGTGKTRFLLDSLLNNKGFYVVVPGIKEQPDNVDGICPSRGGASVDICSLSDALRYYLTPSRCQECFGSLSGLWVDSRFEVRDEFRSVHQSLWKQSDINVDWVRFQINCSSSCDPFDAVWRLYRFSKKRYFIQRSDEALWAIDEVQVALEDAVSNQALLNVTRSIHRRYSQGLEMPRPCILSGTSLRMEKLAEWAHEQRGYFEIGSATTIPLTQSITKKEGFWKLFERHALCIVYEAEGNDNSSQAFVARAGRRLGFPIPLELCSRIKTQLVNIQQRSGGHVFERLHDGISEQCSGFFGRYRWSTFFIEELLQRLVACQLKNENEVVDVNEVTEAAESAATKVKKALKHQLDRIEGLSWTENLYWMALRADVFSQSSIIDDENARLVSEGFALLEDVTKSNSSDLNSAGVSRSRLCEPLAVAAVMEFLRESRKYEAIVERFFSLLQIDCTEQSTIGKMTEYILTTKLDNFLRRSKTSDDLISSNRRRQFLSTLAASGGLSLTDNDYHLDTPEHGSISEPNMSIKGWLDLEAQSKQPPFLFPPPTEGPDLMFILRNNKNLNERVLVVIQFKTGHDAHKENYVDAALRTLVKGEWWKRSLNYEIIFVYVATNSRITTASFEKSAKLVRCETHCYNNFVEKRNSEYLKKGERSCEGHVCGSPDACARNFRDKHKKEMDAKIQKDRDDCYKKCQENVLNQQWHFCYIDSIESANVWGDSFSSWITFMKGQG